MTATLAFIIILVFLALVFDYINGFHDAANSIATVVSTRVLSPGLAVIWAAFFNFIAFAVFGTRVAKSIGDGVRMDIIEPELRLYVLLAALLGAIIWNLITWYLGLPTSSSHALLGGYAGAGIAAYGGVSGLLKAEVWFRTLKFIVLSPTDWNALGIHVDGAGLLDLPALLGDASGQDIQARPAFLSGGFLTGPWRQRCAEDDGHHHSSVDGGWRLGNGLWTRRNVAGDSNFRRARRACRDCVGYVVGRLAHRAYDGHPDHETETGRRLLRRDCRRTDTRIRHSHRNTRLNHSHDYGIDRRCRRDPPVIGSEMGRRRPHRLGLDTHNPRRRVRRRGFVLDRRSNPPPGELVSPPKSRTLRVAWEADALRCATPAQVETERSGLNCIERYRKRDILAS